MVAQEAYQKTCENRDLQKNRLLHLIDRFDQALDPIVKRTTKSGVTFNQSCDLASLEYYRQVSLWPIIQQALDECLLEQLLRYYQRGYYSGCLVIQCDPLTGKEQIIHIRLSWGKPKTITIPRWSPQWRGITFGGCHITNPNLPVTNLQ